MKGGPFWPPPNCFVLQLLNKDDLLLPLKPLLVPRLATLLVLVEIAIGRQYPKFDLEFYQPAVQL